MQGDPVKLELPEGPVPLGSPFYVDRHPIETQAYDAISQGGMLLRIKAPRWMGKTSLLIRVLAQAQRQGCHTAKLNLHQADRRILSHLDYFLRWFCANLSLQLKLEAKLDTYWDPDLGSKVSCTAYLQGHILDHLDRPLVIALDEVNRIFEYPEVAQEFLPLLRFWYEEGRNLEVWSRLRWIVAHATDIYAPLNINQSPFNVGVALQLTKFKPSQVIELIQRHHLHTPETEATMDTLMTLVEGHPYLIRVALYALATKALDLETLLQDATTQTGIYSAHLQGHLLMLQGQPDLAQAFKHVLQADHPISLEVISAYKLVSLGLVVLQGNYARVSCDLYRRYFSDHLAEF